MIVTLRVRVLDSAKAPQYSSSKASSMTLYSNEAVTIPPKAWRIISTGLTFGVPPDYELQIRSLKELAYKGVVVISQASSNGKILTVGLHNLTTKPWFINKGDEIAQAFLSPSVQVHLILEESNT